MAGVLTSGSVWEFGRVVSKLVKIGKTSKKDSLGHCFRTLQTIAIIRILNRECTTQLKNLLPLNTCVRRCKPV